MTASSIEYITRTKGYGIVNRHGVTGQIRAYQLNFIVSQMTCFIKNQYEYYYNEMCDNAEFKPNSHDKNGIKKMLVLVAIMNARFFDTFKNCMNGIFRAGKKSKDSNEGSLRMYLELYTSYDVAGNKSGLSGNQGQQYPKVELPVYEKNNFKVGDLHTKQEIASNKRRPWDNFM